MAHPCTFTVIPACTGNTPDTGTDNMCVGLDVGCPAGTFLVLGLPRSGECAGRVTGLDSRWASGAHRPEDVAAPTFPGLTLTEFRRSAASRRRIVTSSRPGATSSSTMPTNVFASSTEPVVLTTTVLGQPVQVRATPARWSWDFGDGTVIGPTTDPGAAYPALTNTHAYTDRGDYEIVMTTHYTGEFSLYGATWYPIQGEAQVDSAGGDGHGDGGAQRAGGRTAAQAVVRRSGVAAHREPRACTCFVVAEPRGVVREERLGHQLAAAAHAHLVEHRGQVLLHRVRRQVQRRGDAGRRMTLDHQMDDLALPPRQAVRRHQQLEDPHRTRWLHDDADRVTAEEPGGAHGDPSPIETPHPHRGVGCRRPRPRRRSDVEQRRRSLRGAS